MFKIGNKLKYIIEKKHKSYRKSFFHKHDGVYSIDLYAYSSKMKHMNPKFKIVFAAYSLALGVSFFPSNTFIA